jgi:PAB-dependent poly(A)-specific ribonuclease subunit 2
MTRSEIGYFAKNPRTRRRYQIETPRQNKPADALTAPKFLSEKARAAQSAGDTDGQTAATIEELADMHLDDVTRKDVPAMYGNVEIKYSKFGVDDFDFA